MTTAAIYCRRSTAEQGASLRRQEADCRAYADRNGLSVVSVYGESVSAFKPNVARPELDRMLADARQGRFGVLVITEFSRLSRQEGDDSALAMYWRLRKAGVVVRSVTEPLPGVPEADEYVILSSGHRAVGESRTKKDRTRSGKLRSVTQHGVFHGGFAPYGYVRTGRMPAPENPKKNIIVYEADPTASAVVTELFRRYLAGESPHQIADDFNQRQLPAPRSSGVSANPQARRGEPVWQAATARNLLRNPLLAGFAAYKGHRVKSCQCGSPESPAGWNDCGHNWTRSLNLPALIDPEVWQQAQAQVAARRGRVLGGRATGGASEAFLLLGLLWCGECGERLVCRKARQTNTVDRYVCAGRRRRGCTMPTIRRTLLDEALREHAVSEWIVDTEESVRRERTRLLALRDEEATLLRDELATVEAELAEATRLRRQAQLAMEGGEITPAQWSRLDAEYERREQQSGGARRRLRDRLTAVEGSVPVEELDALLDAVSSARRMIAGALEGDDVPRINAKLHELLDSLTVYRRGDKLTVVPSFRSEGEERSSSASSRVLDFGTDATPGVEIGAVLGHVVARKIELTSKNGADDASSPWSSDSALVRSLAFQLTL